MRHASCASIASPSISHSVARPWPTMRGRRWIAPMSAPARPTLTKRNAKRALVETTRKSLASASMAPAPAAMPFTAAMIGIAAGGDAVHGGDDRLFQRAHVLDEVAAHAREAIERVALHFDQLGDDLVQAPAGAEAFALAGDDENLYGGVVGEIEMKGDSLY